MRRNRVVLAMMTFWMCFVPVFVAVDAMGVLPMFLALTEGVPPDRLRHVVLQSVLTAAVVAVAFLAVGVKLLALLGITVADFTVAGGLLLLILSVSDLLSGTKSQRRVDAQTVGAVPLGVPLITGPALLTTALLLMNQHGFGWTLAAVVVNILVAGAVFWFAGPISRVLGSVGARTLSKISSLVLAAIGVMMIRRGLEVFLGGL